MTIEQAQAAKKQMEATILALINTFEQETNLRVASVTVTECWPIGEKPKTASVTTAVSL